MDKEKVMLTEEGRKKFEDELNHLKNVVRPEVTEEIKEAKSQGDLSENADYDAARNKQAEVEGRIQYLENLLAHSEIIRGSASGNVVSVGSKVELLSLDENVTDVYTIVGFAEANPQEGKISNECLLSQAILGHKVGEEIVVKCATPYSVRILKVTK